MLLLRRALLSFLLVVCGIARARLTGSRLLSAAFEKSLVVRDGEHERALTQSCVLHLRGGETGGTKVKHISNANEFDNILASAGDRLVVVDFSATWCGPCKMIAPAYDDISKEYENVVCLKIDVDEVPDITERYQVMAMPTFLFLRGKKVVERFSGASIEKLRATIDQLA